MHAHLHTYTQSMPTMADWLCVQGYTIPLDKRLAADGRGLQQSQINDKFAALSEVRPAAPATRREV